MRIRIEKGIAPPPKRPRLGHLLRQLEVHENDNSKSTFAVPPEHFTLLRNAVSNARRDTTMRFMLRKVKERDSKTKEIVEKLRVWRIK